MSRRRQVLIGLSVLGLILVGIVVASTQTMKTQTSSGVATPTGVLTTGTSVTTPASPGPTSVSEPETEGRPPPNNTTTPTEVSTPGSAEDFATFQRNCVQDLTSDAWHAGDIVYPHSMDLQLGTTAIYDVVLDLRDVKVPPAQLIDATDPTSEPLFVQCVISAKLVAVGPDMDVANDADATGSDGWYDQIFTPAGTVEWTWNVTPRSPGDHELKLLMRPAVAVTYGYAPISSSTGQQAYITHVTVVASTLEQVGYWFDTQFPLIGKIGGILGAAALGILAWLALFSEKWGKLRKRSEKESAAAKAASDSPTSCEETAPKTG